MARQFLLSGYETAATLTGITLSKLGGIVNKHEVVSMLTKAHNGLILAAGTKEVRKGIVTGFLQLVDPNGNIKLLFKAGKLLWQNSGVVLDHTKPILILRGFQG